MLKAVIFDLDHTLIDWEPAETWDVYQPPRFQRLYEFIHNTLHPLDSSDADTLFSAYTRLLREAWDEGNRTLHAPNLARIMTDTLESMGIPREQIDIDAVVDAYDWQPPRGLRAFPDVIDVLPLLRAEGVELGIITNASHPMTLRDRELQAFGLLDHFSTCRLSAGDFGLLKPHRAIFEHALELLDIGPEEAVFVGDNLKADIQGAQGAGIRGVWRAPGPGLAPDLDSIVPDGTIVTFHDLLGLLDGWYPGWRNGKTP
jgi:HAD superfamily hydrolase (TIGR01549 family)